MTNSDFMNYTQLLLITQRKQIQKILNHLQEYDNYIWLAPFNKINVVQFMQASTLFIAKFTSKVKPASTWLTTDELYVKIDSSLNVDWRRTQPMTYATLLLSQATPGASCIFHSVFFRWNTVLVWTLLTALWFSSSDQHRWSTSISKCLPQIPNWSLTTVVAYIWEIYYSLPQKLSFCSDKVTRSMSCTMYSTYSWFIKIEFGVRQGSVLAPSISGWPQSRRKNSLSFPGFSSHKLTFP